MSNLGVHRHTCKYRRQTGACDCDMGKTHKYNKGQALKTTKVAIDDNARRYPVSTIVEVTGTFVNLNGNPFYVCNPVGYPALQTFIVLAENELRED